MERDLSDLHPKLIGLEGKKVRVHPKRESGLSTFIVSRTTGFRPCHLAVRNRNQMGSSDIVSKNETIAHVELL